MDDPPDARPLSIDLLSRRSWQIYAPYSLRFVVTVPLIVLFVHFILQPGGDQFKEVFTGGVEIYIMMKLINAWGRSYGVEKLKLLFFESDNYPHFLFLAIWMFGMFALILFGLAVIGDWIGLDLRHSRAVSMVLLFSALYGASMLGAILQQPDADIAP